MAAPATPARTRIASKIAWPPPTRPDRTRAGAASNEPSAEGDEGSAEVDEDVLRLRVEVERAHPELPPDARHLVAAERRLDVHRAVRVDADHAGLERLRRPQRLADVAAPDRPGQPVLGRVREADRLLLRVERDHRHDRPEDLFAGDPHV